MTKVFMLDTCRKPLDPVHPGYARRLLSRGEAAVFKRYPFTIILRSRVEDKPKLVRLKIDPGSKITGLALMGEESAEVVFAAELHHRGPLIRSRLKSRSALRHGRRNRKTRYRKPRFLNRARKSGWLPPSVESRVFNIVTWVRRLLKLAPIGSISQELVRFDMQKMQNPEISGVEYQQGTLAGFEVREYLLAKWERKCAYCAKENVPLQIEHIVPKSGGGTDRVSNLTLACSECNRKKNSMPVEEFLKDKPEVLKRIVAQAKTPLRDAAALNATRRALLERLRAFGLPVEVGSGGLTKFNRTQRGLAKTHWTDAACVGESTPEVIGIEGVRPLIIRAVGHGNRQMALTDRFGFPKAHRKRQKVCFGFQTGDMAKAVIPGGKHAGTHVGKVTVRSRPSFRLNGLDVHPKYLTLLHRTDGYSYE